MKTFSARFLSVFYSFVILSGAFQASVAFAQKTVLAPVDRLFIPSGFDNNDLTEVVVTGYLPNPCYERPTVQTRIRGNQIQVQVTTALNPGAEAGMCADMIVPYHEAVRVGRLAAGQYQVVVNQNSGGKQLGNLKVGLSTIATSDEYPYAIVSHIEQRTEKDFYLHGYIYSDCLQLDSVRYLSNHKDVISVLPILKRVRQHCPRKMTPFKTKINPPMQTLKSPYFLFHVRSADGKSVNFVGYKK